MIAAASLAVIRDRLAFSHSKVRCAICFRLNNLFNCAFFTLPISAVAVADAVVVVVPFVTLFNARVVVVFLTDAAAAAVVVKVFAAVAVVVFLSATVVLTFFADAALVAAAFFALSVCAFFFFVTMPP